MGLRVADAMEEESGWVRPLPCFKPSPPGQVSKVVVPLTSDNSVNGADVGTKTSQIAEDGPETLLRYELIFLLQLPDGPSAREEETERVKNAHA